MGKRKKRFSFMDMMPTATCVLLYKYYFARGELDKCPPLFTEEQNKLIEALQKKLEKLKKREEAIAKIALGELAESE